MNTRSLMHLAGCDGKRPLECDGCAQDHAVREAIAAERNDWERRLASVGFHRGLTLEQNVAEIKAAERERWRKAVEDCVKGGVCLHGETGPCDLDKMLGA